jgi:hypothetical protein
METVKLTITYKRQLGFTYARGSVAGGYEATVRGYPVFVQGFGKTRASALRAAQNDLTKMAKYLPEAVGLPPIRSLMTPEQLKEMRED